MIYESFLADWASVCVVKHSNLFQNILGLAYQNSHFIKTLEFIYPTLFVYFKISKD